MNKRPFVLLFMLALSHLHVYAESDEDLKARFNIDAPTILTHTGEWEIKPSQLNSDPVIFKNQNNSLLDWKRLGAKRWLDFSYWKDQRASKDKLPQWKLKLRESLLSEKVGQVIQCVEICRRYSELTQLDARFGSELREGDELVTLASSYLWVTLADGSLLRLSPNSSITINEYNLSRSEQFISLRLNYGHVFIQDRKIGRFDIVDKQESDSIFLPLLERKANREYYMIKNYRKLSQQDKRLFYLETNPGHQSQIAQLNSLIESTQDYFLNRTSTIYISTANLTVELENSSVDFYYDLNGKSLVRAYDEIKHFQSKQDKVPKVTFHRRGYKKVPPTDAQFDQTYEIDRDGSSLAPIDKNVFADINILTNRIFSIQLAREYLLKRNFPYLFKDFHDYSYAELARNFGVRLWNSKEEELQKRKAFILEYTRRVETTNLLSLNKLFSSKAEVPFNKKFYIDAKLNYLSHLKEKFSSHSYAMIKEMTDAQYYVWILKYGNKAILSTYSR